MKVMMPTAYESGHKTTDELLGIPNYTSRPDKSERERRMDLARMAIEKLGGMANAGRLFGVTKTAPSNWQNGSKPVPKAYIDTIERIVAADGPGLIEIYKEWDERRHEKGLK